MNRAEAIDYVSTQLDAIGVSASQYLAVRANVASILDGAPCASADPLVRHMVRAILVVKATHKTLSAIVAYAGTLAIAESVALVGEVIRTHHDLAATIDFAGWAIAMGKRGASPIVPSRLRRPS